MTNDRSAAPPCPFCALPSVERVVGGSEHAVVIRDRYPVSEGHSLVVPRRHVESVFALSPRAQGDVWSLVARVRAELLEALRPDGFNVGLNDGEAAGQTIGHAHVHVIPRWHGDVPDPRGGVRWVRPAHAAYWRGPDAGRAGDDGGGQAGPDRDG